MTDLSTLVLRVEGEQGTRALQKYDTAAQRADKSSRLLDEATAKLTKAFALLGGAAAVRELVAVADSMALLQSRLRLATSSTAEYVDVQRRLFEVAQRTRQGLEDTVNLYTRVARSADELGLSQAEVIRLTETVNQSLVVSGATAASASGALTQLAQAFGAGVVRAEEFNSILEGAPRLAQAAAQSLGLTVGQLRTLVNEGGLTSRALADALLRNQSIAKEFSGVQKTVAQSIVQVRNALSDAIGRADASTGSTQALAAALTQLAGAIRENQGAFTVFLRELNNAGAAALGIVKVFRELGVAVDDIGRYIDGVAKAVEGLATFSPSAWVEGIRRMDRANAAYASTLQRIKDLFADGRLREQMSRAPVLSTEGRDFLQGLTGPQQLTAQPFGMFGTDALRQSASVKSAAMAITAAQQTVTQSSEELKRKQQELADALDKTFFSGTLARQNALDNAVALRQFVEPVKLSYAEVQKLIQAQERAAAAANAQANAVRLGIADTAEYKAEVMTATQVEDLRTRGIKLTVGQLERLKQANLDLARAQGAGNKSSPVAQTVEWANQLREVVGVVQLIAAAFGDVGRNVAQAATGAQSILGGLQSAGKLKNAAGEKIGLGTALSGQGGGAALLSGLGAAGQIAAGALQVADALDLFGNRSRERARQMREAAIEFNRALEDFAITSRTSLEESLRANIGKVNALVQQAGKATGVNVNGVDVKSVAELDAFIARLQQAATIAPVAGKAFGTFAGELEALRVIVAANEAELRKRNAAELTMLAEDLEVRSLRARGLTAEADALAATNTAQREYEAAVSKYGETAETARLAQVQLAEATARTAEAARAAAQQQEEQRRSVFDLTNGTRGFSDPRGASQAAFAEEQQRRYSDAVARGASAVELAALTAFQFAEAMDRAAQIFEADTRVREGLVGRGLSTLGDTRGAEDSIRNASQRQELADALREGMSPTNLALLQFVQFAERERVVMLRAIEDGTKAIQEAAEKQIAAIDAQIAAEETRLAQELAGFDAQIQAIEDDTARQLDALEAQRGVLEGILTAAQAQLQTAEAALRISEQAYEALSTFGRSLTLSALSTTSPLQQLAQTRAEFERVATAARQGDGTAAASIPEFARAFLEASRTVNASGSTYSADFARVQQITEALTGQYGARMTTDQQQVASLQSLVNETQRQLELLDQTKTTISDKADAQIRLLQDAKDNAVAVSALIIETLRGERDRVQETADRQIAQLVKLETEAFQARVAASDYYATWQAMTEAQGEASATYQDTSTSLMAAMDRRAAESNAELKAQSASLASLVESQAQQIAALQAQVRTSSEVGRATVERLDDIARKLDSGNQISRRAAEGALAY